VVILCVYNEITYRIMCVISEICVTDRFQERDQNMAKMKDSDLYLSRYSSPFL
jgi:hypothetical protein